MRDQLRRKKVVIILSGGNIDLATLKRVLTDGGEKEKGVSALQGPPDNNR
jgi:threonine dehydratase